MRRGALSHDILSNKFLFAYLDDVNYTLNYIFLFILSYSVYKNYRDAKSLLKRGDEDSEMRTAVSIYADC